MDGLATAYISLGPPFLGDSDFAAKSAVKEAGARWSHESKKWAAADVQTLCRLIGTGVWMPTGIPPRAALRIPEMEKERVRAEDDEAAMQRRDALLKKAEENRMRMAVKAREDLGVPPNEPDLMEQVLAHGVTEKLVADSATYDYLGPRSGISDVRRLLRGVKFKLVSLEEIASGEARLRNSRRQSKIEDHRRGQGERGVKRGRQHKGRAHVAEGSPDRGARQPAQRRQLAQMKAAS